MNDSEIDALEQGFLLGYRAALNRTLRDTLLKLGYDDVEAMKARWVLEREQAVVQLRIVCREVGDNEWSDNDHLADVIEKHLARPVMDKMQEAFAAGEKSGMEQARPLPR